MVLWIYVSHPLPSPPHKIASWLVQTFLHSTSLWPTHTQTMLHVTSVAVGHIYAMQSETCILFHLNWICLYVQRSDMASAQRLCNLTSEVLHSLSHVYHHVSDLMVDMSRTPPRNLHAPPPMPTTAIIQQTIPVQVWKMFTIQYDGVCMTYTKKVAGGLASQV